jgi:hypothetical protein
MRIWKSEISSKDEQGEGRMDKEVRRNALRKLLEEENIKIGIWSRELERFELTKELILRELHKLEEGAKLQETSPKSME